MAEKAEQTQRESSHGAQGHGEAVSAPPPQTAHTQVWAASQSDCELELERALGETCQSRSSEATSL